MSAPAEVRIPVPKEVDALAESVVGRVEQLHEFVQAAGAESHFVQERTKDKWWRIIRPDGEDRGVPTDVVATAVVFGTEQNHPVGTSVCRAWEMSPEKEYPDSQECLTLRDRAEKGVMVYRSYYNDIGGGRNGDYYLYGLHYESQAVGPDAVTPNDKFAVQLLYRNGRLVGGFQYSGEWLADYWILPLITGQPIEMVAMVYPDTFPDHRIQPITPDAMEKISGVLGLAVGHEEEFSPVPAE